MAFFTPCRDSIVRRISDSRACVSTWMLTSSGIRFSSISRRTKLNSVCEADGKPTSISLKPMFTSSWNISSLRSTLMGSISAWLPSRRSVLSQIGALVSTASGQVRSFRPTGANGRYLEAGCCNMKTFLTKKGLSSRQRCGPRRGQKSERPAAGGIRAVEAGSQGCARNYLRP